VRKPRLKDLEEKLSCSVINFDVAKSEKGKLAGVSRPKVVSPSLM